MKVGRRCELAWRTCLITGALCTFRCSSNGSTTGPGRDASMSTGSGGGATGGTGATTGSGGGGGTGGTGATGAAGGAGGASGFGGTGGAGVAPIDLNTA